jgi:enoyl-CoA hydratase
MSQHFIVDQPATGVTRVTFNRPDSLNSFISPMYGELLDILAGIARDPAVRVVVLTGAGRGFSAGHDAAASPPADWVPEGIGKAHNVLHFMGHLAKIPPLIRAMPQVVIAACNGPVAGFGYTIALACDMAIAAKSAKFVNAFHNAGNAAEGGFSYLLNKAVGSQRAAEIMFSPRQVLAEEAERIGLVLRTVPDDKLMDTVLEIARSVMTSTPLDIWTAKQTLHNAQQSPSLEQAIAFETRAIVMINHTADTDEKRAARREKRDPTFHSR